MIGYPIILHTSFLCVVTGAKTNAHPQDDRGKKLERALREITTLTRRPEKYIRQKNMCKQVSAPFGRGWGVATTRRRTAVAVYAHNTHSGGGLFREGLRFHLVLLKSLFFFSRLYFFTKYFFVPRHRPRFCSVFSYFATTNTTITRQGSGVWTHRCSFPEVIKPNKTIRVVVPFRSWAQVKSCKL